MTRAGPVLVLGVVSAVLVGTPGAATADRRRSPQGRPGDVPSRGLPLAVVGAPTTAVPGDPIALGVSARNVGRGPSTTVGLRLFLAPLSGWLLGTRLADAPLRSVRPGNRVIVPFRTRLPQGVRPGSRRLVVCVVRPGRPLRDQTWCFNGTRLLRVAAAQTPGPGGTSAPTTTTQAPTPPGTTTAAATSPTTAAVPGATAAAPTTTATPSPSTPPSAVAPPSAAVAPTTTARPTTTAGPGTTVGPTTTVRPTTTTAGPGTTVAPATPTAPRRPTTPAPAPAPPTPAPPANGAPVAVSDRLTTKVGTPLPIAAADLLRDDADPDGDRLTLAGPTQPQHGTLTRTARGGLLYTPDAGYVGPDTFLYRASDGTLSSVPAVVTVDVTRDRRR